MNLRPAHGDVLEFRRSVMQAASFRGYRPAPVAFTGVLGFVAAAAQLWLQPAPSDFVILWIMAALIGFGYISCCIARSYGASPRRWERSLAFAALNDLSPSMFAGGLVTVALYGTENVHLLPGLWMVLFGTGILSSRRHLPLAATLVGGVYLLTGAAVLIFIPGDSALRAEVMGGCFGTGQLLLAAALKRYAP